MGGRKVKRVNGYNIDGFVADESEPDASTSESEYAGGENGDSDEEGESLRERYKDRTDLLGRRAKLEGQGKGKGQAQSNSEAEGCHLERDGVPKDPTKVNHQGKDAVRQPSNYPKASRRS